MLQNPKININQKDKNDVNVLWVACSLGLTPIAQLFLKKGVDHLVSNSQGLNAMHIAVNKNYPDIVKTLLSYDFPINNQTKQGLTPLLIAVFRQHHECLEILLDSGANVEITNSQGITPLQLSLKLKDNTSAKMLLEHGATYVFTEPNKQKVSPIYHILKVQNIPLLEVINNKHRDFIANFRTNDGQNLLQVAAKNDWHDVVNYLTIIMTHEQINEEDSRGFNPLLYYLMKENFEMCTKLIFRGANVNHLYQNHKGRTALILMVEQKRELAVKFLLDKYANPHICYGEENQDACNIAKQNGLDKRFFVFQKCNGENKLLAQGMVFQQLNDLHEQIVSEFKEMTEIGKNEGNDTTPGIKNLDQIDDELSGQGIIKQYYNMKQSQYDSLAQIDQAENQIKSEMEQYRQKFNVNPNKQNTISLYQEDLPREIYLKIEADRVQRNLEYEELNILRSQQLDYNREFISKQKLNMLSEISELNQKIEEHYSNFMESDYREQFLLDEKISNYKLKLEQNRQDQVHLVLQIQQKDQERERKIQEEKLKKVTEDKELEEIAVRAEKKRQEILNLQEILYKNAQEQKDKEKEIQKERKEVWTHYTNIRKKIDYEQVRMEAMHLRKQVENDFLEKEIQDRIKTAKLALDLKIGQIDLEGKKVDSEINIAQMRRGKFNQYNPNQEEVPDNWSEEDVLWESYKERQQNEKERKRLQQQSGSDFNSSLERSERSLKFNQSYTKDFNPKVTLQGITGNQTRKHYETKSEIYNVKRGMTLEQEMQLADQMINDLSLKINNFAPGYHQKNKTPLKNSNQKFMQKAFNKNPSNKSLAQNRTQIRIKNDFKTAPSSPTRSYVSLAKNELNAFIKNRQQVELEKKFERKRNNSNLRSAVYPQEQLIGISRPFK